MHELLINAVAFVVGSIAVARAARLAVADQYPPMIAVRRWWLGQTVAKGGWREGWSLVLVAPDGGNGCPFCFAPYAAAVDLTWWLLADGWWAEAWWIVNVWAAVSYIAAMVVLRDEPPAED